jgi:hypothetical protein
MLLTYVWWSCECLHEGDTGFYLGHCYGVSDFPAFKYEAKSKNNSHINSEDQA